jgi:hypothetical protein
MERTHWTTATASARKGRLVGEIHGDGAFQPGKRAIFVPKKPSWKASLRALRYLIYIFNQFNPVSRCLKCHLDDQNGMMLLKSCKNQGIPPIYGRIPSKIIKNHQKSSKFKVSQHLQIISDANLADHLSSPAETKGGRCTSAQCQDGLQIQCASWWVGGWKAYRTDVYPIYD